MRGMKQLYEAVAVADVGLLQSPHPVGHHAPNLKPEAALALGPLEAGVEGRVQRGQVIQLAEHCAKYKL